MSAWAWAWLVLFLIYNTSILWRAWRNKQFKYGPIIYSLGDSPGYFWFFAAVFTICELFLLAMFTWVVASTVWGAVPHP